MSESVTKQTRRLRGPGFLTSQLVRLVNAAGEPVTTYTLASAVGHPPAAIQRLLLYAARCGRIERLAAGTPGWNGTPAIWVAVKTNATSSATEAPHE